MNLVKLSLKESHTARTMILVLLAQACTLAAEDPSADKPAAVKKPRSYTRTLNFHSAKTTEIEHPMEKAAGRPEKDFLKLDRFRPPTAFSPPTMPIPVLPPPGQSSSEPGRKKNWILPPMAEDLKHNRYSFSKEGEEEEERGWGWLERSIRERRDEDLREETEEDEDALDREAPGVWDPESEAGRDRENRPSAGLITDPPDKGPLRLSPETSLLLLEPANLHEDHSLSESITDRGASLDQQGTGRAAGSSDTLEEPPPNPRTHRPLGSGASPYSDLSGRTLSPGMTTGVTLGALNDRIRSGSAGAAARPGSNVSVDRSSRGARVPEGRFSGFGAGLSRSSTPSLSAGGPSSFSSLPGATLGSGMPKPGGWTLSSPGTGGFRSGSAGLGGSNLNRPSSTRAPTFSPVQSYNSRPSLSTSRDRDFWDR